jgi:hypothetical protein
VGAPVARFFERIAWGKAFFLYASPEKELRLREICCRGARNSYGPKKTDSFRHYVEEDGLRVFRNNEAESGEFFDFFMYLLASRPGRLV